MVLSGQIIGSNKPWEAIVGQAIGTVMPPKPAQPFSKGSLFSFLGDELVDSVLRPA